MRGLPHPSLILGALELAHLPHPDAVTGFAPRMLEGLEANTSAMADPGAVRPLRVAALLPRL